MRTELQKLERDLLMLKHKYNDFGYRKNSIHPPIRIVERQIHRLKRQLRLNEV